MNTIKKRSKSLKTYRDYRVHYHAYEPSDGRRGPCVKCGQMASVGKHA